MGGGPILDDHLHHMQSVTQSIQLLNPVGQRMQV